MKKCPKPDRQQINLLLRDPAANTNTAIPADKQEELTRALTEFLLARWPKNISQQVTEASMMNMMNHPKLTAAIQPSSRLDRTTDYATVCSRYREFPTT